MFKRKSNRKHYWFTIQSPNGQTLATSETYTTAAMRDKGIEAVKKVVGNSIAEKVIKEWVSKKKGKEFKQKVLPDRKRDTFHLESAKGKILKR